MKKIEHYYPYVILGLPVAITTVITHQLGFSGLYSLLVGLIMTFYSMFAYFKPDKKNNISSIAASFFLIYWICIGINLLYCFSNMDVGIFT
jgi:hypothetical protein